MKGDYPLKAFSRRIGLESAFVKVSGSYLLTVTDMPSKSLYPHFVNGCCGLTELTCCPESHRWSGAELGFALEPLSLWDVTQGRARVSLRTASLWDLTQGRARVSLRTASSRQMAAGGKVVLSSRVMNVSLLLGLVWVLLFHKCNERKHISVPIKLLGLYYILKGKKENTLLFSFDLKCEVLWAEPITLALTLSDPVTPSYRKYFVKSTLPSWNEMYYTHNSPPK